MAVLIWDIYCRVIDNYGDAGVCWRLAADLARRGQQVRLVMDDPAPLAFMAPAGAAGVTVWPWPGPADTPGDVVIEAFGCDPPAARVAAMAQRSPAPVWINLEYLSAEPYVERSHGLPSPQRNGLTKWFFYPGFTARTGGLLREPGLDAQRLAFDRSAWLAAQGVSLRAGERVVSLFCYDNPRIPALLDELAQSPTLLLATPGYAQAQLRAQPARAGLRVHELPYTDQGGFDRMLWASELNFVRGEDSLVRALWAGAPFVWQIYPQDDQAHAVKLQALLEWLAAPAAWAPQLAATWWAWNQLGSSPWPALPELDAWASQARLWRTSLQAQDDLVTQLLRFAATRLQAG
jgi:uncharacterized repeat protein (TIGR03837 family)